MMSDYRKQIRLNEEVIRLKAQLQEIYERAQVSDKMNPLQQNQLSSPDSFNSN